MARSGRASLGVTMAGAALCAGRVQAAPPIPSRVTTESLLAEVTDLAGVAAP
ncbi:MAG: hypothetical protein KBE04_08720 [Phycisphaerae bacterium]|nr:hypothetical protein [Phycisphaerae bacterium]